MLSTKIRKVAKVDEARIDEYWNGENGKVVLRENAKGKTPEQVLSRIRGGLNKALDQLLDSIKNYNEWDGKSDPEISDVKNIGISFSISLNQSMAQSFMMTAYCGHGSGWKWQIEAAAGGKKWVKIGKDVPENKLVDKFMEIIESTVSEEAIGKGNNLQYSVDFGYTTYSK